MKMLNATNFTHEESSEALEPTPVSSSCYVSPLSTSTDCWSNSISSHESEQNTSSTPSTQSINNSKVTFKPPEHSMTSFPGQTKNRIEGEEFNEFEKSFLDDLDNVLESVFSRDGNSNASSDSDCSRVATTTLNSASTTSYQQADQSCGSGGNGDEKISSSGGETNDEDGKKEGDNGEKKIDERPGFSLTALAIMAIRESPHYRLTVDGIYEYIAENYPYYRQNKQAWLHLIQITMSESRFFVKVPRVNKDLSRGFYWMLHPRSEAVQICKNTGRLFHRSNQVLPKQGVAVCLKSLLTDNQHRRDSCSVGTPLNDSHHPFNTSTSSVYHSASTSTAANMVGAVADTRAVKPYGNAFLSSSLPPSGPSTAFTASSINEFPIDPVRATCPDSYARNRGCNFVPPSSQHCQYQQGMLNFPDNSTYYSNNSISSKMSEVSQQSSWSIQSTQSNSEIAFKSPGYSMTSSYALPGQTKNNVVDDATKKMKKDNFDGINNLREYPNVADYSNFSSHSNRIRTAATTLNSDLTISSQRADQSGSDGKSREEKTKREKSLVAHSALVKTGIQFAIENSPHRCQTLSGIYEYMLKHFPYFKKNKRLLQQRIGRVIADRKCFVKVPRRPNESVRLNFWTYDASRDDLLVDKFGRELIAKSTRVREDVPLGACGKASVTKNPQPNHTSSMMPALNDYHHLYRNRFNSAAPSAHHSTTVPNAAHVTGVAAPTAATLPHGNAVHTPSPSSADPSTALTTSKFNKYSFDPAQATSADNTTRGSSCSYVPDPYQQSEYQDSLEMLEGIASAFVSLGSHRSNESVFPPNDKHFPQ